MHWPKVSRVKIETFISGRNDKYFALKIWNSSFPHTSCFLPDPEPYKHICLEGEKVVPALVAKSGSGERHRGSVSELGEVTTCPSEA